MASRNPVNPWQYATMGLELVGTMGVLIALGYGFDRWQDTSPWGVLIGAFIGIAGGLAKIIRDAGRVMKSMNQSANQTAGQGLTDSSRKASTSSHTDKADKSETTAQHPDSPLDTRSPRD